MTIQQIFDFQRSLSGKTVSELQDARDGLFDELETTTDRNDRHELSVCIAEIDAKIVLMTTH